MLLLRQRKSTASAVLFCWWERFERERRRGERENSPTPPVAEEVGEFEWQSPREGN